ncbi:MAG: glycosyltransferase family 39 protein [Methanocellales archaeon]|nr:glycosyltransferase family 39 protein [Methanocellales archaeon]MDD3291750.1 glycosyltransferase family 39 protein [Methanocellales archaeon]MDD5235100.1 glycosyltransferase family 39 protein [Methanocellales archaeon]MDD5485238.1 glycosyltransferase family 39 protein [Methanocellales archaeon]
MERDELLKISLILVASLIVRVLLFPAEGYYIDTNTFTAWHMAAAEGLRTFYDRIWSDYPPFSVYIFWIFGSVAKHFSLFNTSHFVYLLKLPSNLFDLGISLLIFFFLRKKIGFNHAAFIMAIYAFNPATIYNLAVWGQMDSIYTFFMISSLLLLIYEKPELSAASLAIAMLTKPQSIAILPAIALFILKKYDVKRIVTSLAASAASVFLVILPFRWDNPLEFLINIYSTGYGYYAFNSVSAYNIWAFAGFWKPDSIELLFLSCHVWGIILFGALVLFVLYCLNKRDDTESLIFSSFLLSFGFFMLMTRMHERYMFPVFALLALIMNHEKIKKIYGTLAATYLFNLAYILSFISGDNFVPDNDLSLMILPLINLAILVYSLYIMHSPRFPKKIELKDGGLNLKKPDLKKLVEMIPDREVVSKIKITRRDLAVMFILTITFFSITVFNLGSTEMPATEWHSINEAESFYIDLGSVQTVDRIAILIKDENATNVDIYSGSPDHWNFSINYARSGVYYFWDDVPISSCDARYIRFDFEDSSADILEIAVFGNKKKLEIKDIIDRYGNAQSDGRQLKNLIDEQVLVEEPLTYKAGTYFDEIYFVRTAYEHIELKEPFEWTHPPLSKLIIACGILLFGSNPFAWRILEVLFATSVIPIMFMFGKKISGTSLGGFIAAFLMTFDFMHFAETRLATGDTFIFFFLILMFYFFFDYFQGAFKKGWKEAGLPLFLSTLFFGLAFSTKWYAMYGFMGMAFLFVLLKLKEFASSEKKDNVQKYLFYPLLITCFSLAISIAIYMLTYIPHMLAGHSLGDVINLQFTMYGYHSSLTAPHPFASSWWSWPLMLKPMWIYGNNLDGIVSTIVLMGNPAIWWVGIIFLILTATKMVRDGDKTCMFIVVLFLFQWLPYVPISRALFIYHFYANLPFMVLAITYGMNNLWNEKTKWFVIFYLMVTLILFFIYYPVISGCPISYEYKEGLRLLESWIF